MDYLIYDILTSIPTPEELKAKEIRSYEKDWIKTPSVTWILSMVNNNLDNLKPEVFEHWTKIHKTIEEIFKTKDILSIIEKNSDFIFWNRIDTYVNLLLSLYKDKTKSLVSVEKEFISPYWYAGTIDYIGKEEHNLFIVDHKTTSKQYIDIKTLYNYYIQAVAYSFWYEDCQRTVVSDTYIWVLPRNNNPYLINLNRINFNHGATINTFLILLYYYHSAVNWKVPDKLKTRLPHLIRFINELNLPKDNLLFKYLK